MRIFVDLGHPAHVHYIKNFYSIMSKKGHEFFVSARNKDCNHALLHFLRIPFFNRGKGGRSFFTKGLYLLKTDIILCRLAKRFKPDVFISFSSPYAAHASALCRTTSIVLDDTEKNRFTQIAYRPFTKKILTPDCYQQEIGKKQVRFPSYLEMLYLHPERFKPDPAIIKELGVEENERYFILRFVSLRASHDIGDKGISRENKIKLVNILKKYGKVFISSEDPVPYELSQYSFPLSPEKMHHALKHAHLIVGESATMTSEAAVLGTPAIYVNNDGRGYTLEEEDKYGLVANFSESDEDQERVLKKAEEAAADKDFKNKLKNNHIRLLKDKIDLTQWLVDYVENKEFNK